MKNTIFLIMMIAVLLMVLSCNKETEPISDPTYFLRGVVRDSATSTGIGGAWIGHRNPLVADSLLFQGDSLNASVPNGVLDITLSQSDGSFEIAAFLAVRDTTRYKYLFAYKSGYTLWRYDRQRVAITQTNSYTDQVEIRLKP